VANVISNNMSVFFWHQSINSQHDIREATGVQVHLYWLHTLFWSVTSVLWYPFPLFWPWATQLLL